MSKIANTHTASKSYHTRLSIIGLLILIIALLVSSCGPLTSDVIVKYRTADTKPEGVDEYACDGLCPYDEAGHSLTVANVPDGVTAYFAPIPAEEQEQLKALDFDGFTCLNSISGNLTFYNDKTQEWVTSFAETVTITVDYTYADLQAVKDCGSELEDKDLWQDLVPVFLYMPAEDESVNIWKPFSDYTVIPLEFDPRSTPDMKAGTIEIRFNFWGDDPKGFGSPKGSI